jgi:hypothetical protein
MEVGDEACLDGGEVDLVEEGQGGEPLVSWVDAAVEHDFALAVFF